MKLSFPLLPRISDRTRLGFVLVAVTIASLTTILASSATTAEERVSNMYIGEPGSSELALFGGKWKRIADDEAEAARLTNIDDAVEDLTWIVRKMAGGVLKKSTVPPPEMSFTWDGVHLHQLVRSRKGEQQRLVRLGGAPETFVDPRGGDFSSTWIWTELGLQLDWVQHQAHGRNIYRVDARDQTLVVESRIQITAISGVGPIVYRSRFGRAELPAVAAAAHQTGSTPLASERR